MSIYLFAIALTTPVQDSQYSYQYIPNIRVTGVVANKFCEGTLAKDGAFEPDISMLFSGKSRAQGSGIGAPYYTIGFTNEQKLYEYRSGILIPVIYYSKLGIVPEIGGKIIDIKEYRYSPTARRIYNLPGRFVLKENKQGKEK